MTLNTSQTTDYSPMHNDNTLPVKNGLKTMTVYVDKTMDQKVAPVETEEETEPCGWGPCTPRGCQRFRRPGWMLFWLCWAGAIQGMVVNGFVNVVISTVERRYDMSSTESGIIASSYDIASVLCLIPVSYFGGLGCKPKYLGIGVFVMAIGSFIFSLPKFTEGPYELISGGENLCDVTNNSTGACDNKIQKLSNYKFVFYLGQFLHGAGAAPLYTLGTTYLDENLPLRSSSMYIGIYYAFAIVGPAIGYLLGGAFLDIYVDFDSVDTDSILLKPTSSRWLGAWWIGFLLSGVLALLISIPMCGFPTSLPGSAKYQAEKGKEVYSKKSVATSSDVPNRKGLLLGVWSSVKVLLTNPTFMFLNLAAAAEGNLLAGFATFAPKFIEAQFSLQSSTAAMYIGYAAVPAGGGGTFLGGYLVKRFNLGLKGIIRLCLGVSLPALLCILIFLIKCENSAFAGVNVDYTSAVNGSTSTKFLGDFVEGSCTSSCHCSMQDYNPVCGTNQVVYYSPCYAGCQSALSGGETQGYGNCSCISASTSGRQAELGKCEASCVYLPLFLPVFAIVMFLTFIASMPALTATLRCVPQKDRSFALGIQWIIARCLGSIPGPILFGKLIDITCQLWQNSCGEQGSCFFYNNNSMSNNMLAVGLVGKFLSCLFFFLALMLYKSSSCDENSNSTSADVSGKLTKDNQASVDTLTTSVNDLSNSETKSGVNVNGETKSGVNGNTKYSINEDSQRGVNGGGDNSGKNGDIYKIGGGDFTKL